MSDKIWRKRPLDRKSKHRKPVVPFLIVCEGKQTERNYFSFFDTDKKFSVVEWTGTSNFDLVRDATNIVKKYKSAKTSFIRVWCVFDKDNCTKQQLNNAYSLAKENGFQIAFSNICFEVWILLHFKYYTNQLSGNDTIKEVSKMFNDKYGIKYKKNGKIYEPLQNLQKEAIRNSKKIEAFHKNRKPVEKNPFSDVYKLVEELNKKAKTYSSN